MIANKNIELINFNDILTHTSLEKLLEKVKELCSTEENSRSKRRRIYSVAVELLDNSYMHTEIYRYSDLSIKFKLFSHEDKYIIEVTNIIANTNIAKLQDRLDLLKSKTKVQLKELYKIKIINSQISDKGGAGIGLIDIARKSENSISYNFKKINGFKSYFTLVIEIN